MSRHQYTDECDGWSLIRWRGAVKSAIRGMRGQELLHGLRSALDAMPTKRLIKEKLIDRDGEVCALGALGLATGRRHAMRRIDPEDSEGVAELFGVSDALVREVQFMNDEAWWRLSPEQRWVKMRQWVESKIYAEKRSPTENGRQRVGLDEPPLASDV